MANMGMGAVYTFYKNGKKVETANNLLTQGFYNRLLTFGGDNSEEVGRYICLFIGTGTTEPTESDTGMETNFATSSILDSVEQSNQTVNYISEGGRYVGEFNWTVTYNAGTFSGQSITEVGARFSPAQGSNRNNPNVIDSHALIKDGNGNVVPIILGASDVLSVGVKFRWTIPYNERSNIVVNGQPHLVRFGAVNVTDSGATGYWCPFFKETWFTTHAYLGASQDLSYYPSFFGMADRQTGSQSLITPTATYSLGTAQSNTTYNQITAVVANQGNRTLDVTYQCYFTSAENTLTIGGLTIGKDNSSSNDHVARFVFEPPLDNLTGSAFTITVKYKFGGYGLNNDIPPMTVECVPDVTETLANGTSTTAQVGRIKVLGGKEPYTYAWTYVSGGSALLSADSPTGVATKFTGTGTTQTSNETWQCQVTDSSPTPKVVSDTMVLNINWA